MALEKDVRAVVTGGGSGLGRELVLEIARRGGQVVVADLDASRAEETVRLVEGLGGRAFAVVCDVTRLEEVEALAVAAEESLGEVNLVVNNAGVAVGGPFGEVEIDDWRWVMGVNLWGVIHGCQVFYPRLKRRRGGAILNVASAAGILSPPELSPYNVSKAGVVALSETLYAEARAHGVSVTVLCPTFFRTRLLETARGPDESAREVVEKLMARSRVQAPEVARRALDDVRRGRLYSVPMRDGWILWQLKRLAPQRFYGLLAAYAGRVQRGRARRAG